MITNFEEITSALTSEEKSQIVVVIRILQLRKKENPILSESLEKLTNMRGSRLRKIINLIRSLGIIPIIGTSRGYYISEDIEDINKEICSLNERAEAIQNAATGLKIWIARRIRKNGLL